MDIIIMDIIIIIIVDIGWIHSIDDSIRERLCGDSEDIDSRRRERHSE
jgi:hypothetical protein